MKAKILIVDDDPDIATMLEDRLQASDYGTVIARDGVEALELIEQEAPHLMLLDLDMPRLTGIEVLKRLQKVRPAEDLPVIVMTAHASIDAAVEAMKAGAYDFLTKPLDKDHLLIVIGKAIERDSLETAGGLSQIRNRRPLRVDCGDEREDPGGDGVRPTRREVRCQRVAAW